MQTVRSVKTVRVIMWVYWNILMIKKTINMVPAVNNTWETEVILELYC